MIAERHIYKVKWGRMQDAIAMLKTESERSGFMPYRIYTDITGPGSTMVGEWEYEDLAALERTYAKWFSDPDTQAWIDKFGELIDELNVQYLKLE